MRKSRPLSRRMQRRGLITALMAAGALALSAPSLSGQAPGKASRVGSLPAMPRTFRWGMQSPDLVRYNRVEGASLGARLQIRPYTPVGPVTVNLDGRLGSADRVPNVRVELGRETLTSHATLRTYHELTAVDQAAGHLGVGNSLAGLLFGRDDGEYFRRSGAEVAWTPPSSRRTSFQVVGFAEYHTAVETNTGFDLRHLADDSWTFRPNLAADEGWEVGGQLALSPWWGTDPRRVQGGLEASARASAGGFEYARASLTGRLAVPVPPDLRLGLEAGGGTSWGEPPAQRLWLLGGAGSLRGYGPRTREGTSYLRARAELSRAFAFGWLVAFTDVGWAGERELFQTDDALVSVGLGLSLVDGLIRFDAGWGLREPTGLRMDLYLDAIL